MPTAGIHAAAHKGCAWPSLQVGHLHVANLIVSQGEEPTDDPDERNHCLLARTGKKYHREPQRYSRHFLPRSIFPSSCQRAEYLCRPECPSVETWAAFSIRNLLDRAMDEFRPNLAVDSNIPDSDLFWDQNGNDGRR